MFVLKIYGEIRVYDLGRMVDTDRALDFLAEIFEHSDEIWYVPGSIDLD